MKLLTTLSLLFAIFLSSMTGAVAQSPSVMQIPNVAKKRDNWSHYVTVGGQLDRTGAVLHLVCKVSAKRLWGWTGGARVELIDAEGRIIYVLYTPMVGVNGGDHRQFFVDHAVPAEVAAAATSCQFHIVQKPQDPAQLAADNIERIKELIARARK